jgi:hypothetical protein
MPSYQDTPESIEVDRLLEKVDESVTTEKKETTVVYVKGPCGSVIAINVPKTAA